MMFNKPSFLTVGQVTLVGAGPGDPELLTIKALKAIQAATVLLVDDLVSEEIVSMAAKTARVLWVGKRGGCESTPQSFIEKLMITAAREGENVVRLKGGDPFMFGRGGEEIEHLQAEGVRVRVINGITSGLAAATSLNIPVTHRDYAQGVIFVTGHSKPGINDVDWAMLASTAHLARLTLVIYMGIGRSRQIEKGLLQGFPANTPVVLVQDATLPHQVKAKCELSGLCHTIESLGISSPAIIIVGQVVQLFSADLESAQAVEFISNLALNQLEIEDLADASREELPNALPATRERSPLRRLRF
jgi:uroporphyrin-III C-methyltransferase